MSSRTARPESSAARLHECDACGMRVPADTVTDEYLDKDLCEHCAAEAQRDINHRAEMAANRALDASLVQLAKGLGARSCRRCHGVVLAPLAMPAPDAEITAEQHANYARRRRVGPGGPRGI